MSAPAKRRSGMKYLSQRAAQVRPMAKVRETDAATSSPETWQHQMVQTSVLNTILSEGVKSSSS